MVKDDKYTVWEERDIEEESRIVGSFIERHERQKKAFEEMTAKADDGDVHAQYNMGKFCEAEQAEYEVKEDSENFMAKGEEAFMWYSKSAKGGYAEAQYQLALFYLYGNGGTVDIDHKQAKYWLEQASQQEHLDAEYQLSKDIFKNS